MDTTVVSLFSGCGGLDAGFVQAGFDISFACDNDPDAVSVYRENLGNHVELVDVTDPSFQTHLDELPNASVVLGGFPCQGFSKAGPKRLDDQRNNLFIQMQNVVEKIKPAVFVAENVDGIVQNFNGHYLKMIKDSFGNSGYIVEHRVLDAAQFGVPQHRRRTFFVGIRSDLNRVFSWPTPSHQAETRNGERDYDQPLWDWRQREDLSEALTIENAIGDLIKMTDVAPDHEIVDSWPGHYDQVMYSIGAGQKLCNSRFSSTSVHTWDIPEVYGAISPTQRNIVETIGRNRRHKRYGDIPNGNPLPEQEIARLSGISQMDLKDELLYLETQDYVARRGRGWELKGAMFCSGIFKRPLWDEPAPTVLTNFHNPRYFIHPLENRPFSARECARLQGFGDDFVLSDKSNGIGIIDKYRLVGNAVPPPMANALATQIMKVLDPR